jgi:hypothetical protein
MQGARDEWIGKGVLELSMTCFRLKENGHSLQAGVLDWAGQWLKRCPPAELR